MNPLFCIFNLFNKIHTHFLQNTNIYFLLFINHISSHMFHLFLLCVGPSSHLNRKGHFHFDRNRSVIFNLRLELYEKKVRKIIGFYTNSNKNLADS